MGIRVRLAVLGLAGILALSGCASSATGSAVGLPGFGGSGQSATGSGQSSTGTGAVGGDSGSDPGSDSAGSDGSSGTGGDLGGLPGAGGLGSFNSACLGVASAYASIMLALLPALTGGQGGTYNADQIAKAVGGLSGNIPDELKADFAVVSAAAAQATGKSLAEAGQILDDPTVKKATDDIDAWMTKNCGG